jgi:hypothetical protein
LNKSNLITLIALVIAAAGIPSAFLMGKQSAAKDLQLQFDETIDDIQTTHDVYLETMQEALTTAQAQWDLTFEQHLGKMREALLNTGVPLEVLDAEPIPVVPNFPIAQVTYEMLKPAMTYEEVVAIIGREGENSFNLVDADGTGTRTFSWRWLNEDEEGEIMDITFENGKLSNKYFSPFKL